MAYIIHSSLFVVLLMVLGSYSQDNAGARLAVGVADERRTPHVCIYSWGRWSRWTQCIAKFGKGFQARRRHCFKRCFSRVPRDELFGANRTQILQAMFAQMLLLRDAVPSSYCSPGPTRERQECSGCLGGHDVIFVIDRSGSIGETNFNLMVDQVNSVIQLLDLDTGLRQLSKVRVGIELFNHGQLAYNHLNNFAVPTTPYPYSGGGTNIAAAITFAHQVMFTSPRGDRTSHNPNIMVVITDGQSASPIAAAQAAKADGIKIIAVGVGNNVNLSHLRGIVTDVSTDLYTTNNFCSIADYLRRRFDCNSNKFRAALTPVQCTRTVFGTSSDAGSDGGEEEARKSSA